MYRVYSHTDATHDGVEIVTDLDDEDVDAWVCPPDHDDYAVFKEAGADVVFDSIDRAYLHLVSQKVIAASQAWTRKEGKNKNGGLNAKGRASYKGHLKPPTPRGPRHKSFCARMRGMKKKLTGGKTAHDPNSRINKSLRKWKC
jgi:hypothetical protein